MINKTTNTTFALTERTNAAIVQKWHECVNEFCRSAGIDPSNAQEVKFLHPRPSDTNTEVFIQRRGIIIGKVSTSLKQTAAGLKFTITCQQVPPTSPAEEKEATETP
jgi:hypothetical protein